MKGKVAVLGHKEFVLPFSALGVDTFPVSGDDEIKENAREIINQRYALVVVAENIARVADEIFSTRIKEATPGVLVVPFTTESTGYATESLGRVLKLATGIDILQNS